MSINDDDDDDDSYYVLSKDESWGLTISKNRSSDYYSMCRTQISSTIDVPNRGYARTSRSGNQIRMFPTIIGSQQDRANIL